MNIFLGGGALRLVGWGHIHSWGLIQGFVNKTKELLHVKIGHQEVVEEASWVEP